MPLKYEPSEHAFFTEGDCLTEQEHADSCDINKMILNVHRGLDVRGGSQPSFGYDDMNMDLVQHLILKQQNEAELRAIAENNEFSEKEFNLIPEAIRAKFKFKKSKAAPEPQTTIKTTTTGQQAAQDPNPTPTPTPQS